MSTIKKEGRSNNRAGTKRKVIGIEHILCPYLGCSYMNYVYDNFLRCT